jgi:hypothetical protein
VCTRQDQFESPFIGVRGLQYLAQKQGGKVIGARSMCRGAGGATGVRLGQGPVRWHEGAPRGERTGS